MTRAIKWWITGLAVCGLLALHFSRPAAPAWCTTNLVHWWQPGPDDPAVRMAFCR